MKNLVASIVLTEKEKNINMKLMKHEHNGSSDIIEYEECKVLNKSCNFNTMDIMEFGRLAIVVDDEALLKGSPLYNEIASLLMGTHIYGSCWFAYSVDEDIRALSQEEFDSLTDFIKAYKNCTSESDADELEVIISRFFRLFAISEKEHMRRVNNLMKETFGF